MNPEQIRKAWEQRWQELSFDQIDSFLARDELRSLSQLPGEAVLRAIQQRFKLVDILAEATASASTGLTRPAKRSLQRVPRQKSSVAPHSSAQYQSMAEMAHEEPRLRRLHYSWLLSGRVGRGECGCDYDPGGKLGHELSVAEGPRSSALTSAPSAPTVTGRCECGWTGRAGSELALRALWSDHLYG